MCVVLRHVEPLAVGGAWCNLLVRDRMNHLKMQIVERFIFGKPRRLSENIS